MMKDMKNSLTSSNDEGTHKVMNEDFAFFMESSTIEYETERNCNLTKVGSQLDEKGYGIAMRKSESHFFNPVTSKSFLLFLHYRHFFLTIYIHIYKISS